MRQKIELNQFLNGVAALYSKIEETRGSTTWPSHVEMKLVRGRLCIRVSQVVQTMYELKRIFGVRFVPEYKHDSYEYDTGKYFAELEFTDS